MSYPSKIKQTADRVLSNHGTLAVAGVGAFAAVATFALFTGAIDIAAAQISVCGGQSMSSSFQNAINRLISFIIFAAFGGAILHSSVQHLRLAAGKDKGKKFYQTKSMKAAFTLPFALYGIDFALASIFEINVTCLFPWG